MIQTDVGVPNYEGQLVAAWAKIEELMDNLFESNNKLFAANNKVSLLEARQEGGDASDLEISDLKARSRANTRITAQQHRFYEGLLDLYPELLLGDTVSLDAPLLRLECGDVGREVARTYILDLVSQEAVTYDSMTGLLTANLDVFTAPEDFNLKELERARKAREKAEEQAKKFRHALQTLVCENCGCKDIVNDVTARCKGCGHIHETVVGIPSKLITIKPEEAEAMLDQPFTFTAKEFTGFIAPVVEERPSPVAVALPFNFDFTE